jgi:dephospho-CoA kinase
LPKLKKLLQRFHIVIIITGGISSGKSFILRYMKKLGFATFQSDLIATEAMQSEIFKNNLDSKIMQKISTDNEKIDRQKLLNVIIAEPIIFDEIEIVLHSIVQQIRSEWIYNKRYKKKRSVVLEIPLFFEKTLQSRADEYSNALVISTVCGLERQKRRARMRTNFSSEAMLSLITAKQCSDSTRKSKSDIVIYTHGNKLYVKNKIKKLISYGTRCKNTARNSTRY